MMGDGSNNTTKKMTNNVLLDQTFPISQSYLKKITELFQAGVHLEDLRNHPETARQTFNERIGKLTHGGIKEALPDSKFKRDYLIGGLLTNLLRNRFRVAQHQNHCVKFVVYQERLAASVR